jgi:hypothetical protein
MGCHEEDVPRRPVWCSAHERVKERPGGGANNDACGGTSDSCGAPGAGSAHNSVCGGANYSGSVQGHDSSGTHDGAYGAPAAETARTMRSREAAATA